MLHHHLKIAFRNLRKYKTQNTISIIGLAVGFTCFAFSALWIRYEMSYDNFHPKADRIYRVHTALYKWNTVESGSNEEIQSSTSYQLANWLKSYYPEIEEACGIFIQGTEPLIFLYLDQNFCKIFDLNLQEDIFTQERTIAVSHAYEEVVKSFYEQRNSNVRITPIPNWPVNTNIQFTMATPFSHRWSEETLNRHVGVDTYILVKNGVDINALKEKLDKVEFSEWNNPISLILTPLRQLRYNDPTGNTQSDIKFAHIQIFALAGLLVILCSLFNCLILDNTRVRMRLRELALRKVNGATDWQIAAALYTDSLLVILLSLVVGFMLMALLLPAFREYAAIDSNDFSIYSELTLYAVLLMVCGFVAGSIPVLYARKQVLNESIKGFGKPSSQNLFRKGSLLVQLIISLGMMFCSVVFIKQFRFLHYTDLGINRRNIASVEARHIPLLPPYADQIKQVPGIIDAIPIESNSFLTNMYRGGGSVHNLVDSTGNKVSMTIFNMRVDARFFDFFGVEIIKGTVFPNEFDNYKFILNETAMKEIGEIESKRANFMGVARDFYLTPTTKVKPTSITYGTNLSAIAYKYEEDMRKQTEEAVIQWLRKKFPYDGEFEIIFNYMEDIFDEHFKSERALIKLLSVMTLACLLIAVFGVYSLTNLTCQQRRKEIAIRKVHGAEVLDIMNIFFKEYLILLALAAIVAFPTGYIIMKHWMEGYVKQTSMDAWLFVAIFLVVFVVIIFSIVSLVWKAANQNPSEVVKSE